tara:strand:+ start:1733 stop:2512 length:780 start_codon:yes stop_codon:yes gene_type:complete
MKVSIVTLTNNSEKNIQRCINSIKYQTYNNIEHIIIDNNSSDKTIDIIKSNSDYNFSLVSEKDKGIYDGWNKGFKIASGEIIGTVMADDLLKNKNVIKDIVKNFNKTSADIVYGNLDFINEDGAIVRQWKSGSFSTLKFYLGWMPPPPSVYQRRHIIKNNDLFKLKFHIAADYEFYLRLFLVKKYNIAYLDKYIYSMEYGGVSNKSFKNILIANIQCYKSWKENNIFQLPLIIITKPLFKIFQFRDLKFFFNQYFNFKY